MEIKRESKPVSLRTGHVHQNSLVLITNVIVLFIYQNSRLLLLLRLLSALHFRLLHKIS